MIELSRKEDCCGCGACFSACPVNAITMQSDKEGFVYPEINSNCINCGKCDKVCPVINCKPDNVFEQQGYVVQNKNEKVLRESTSGGAFSVIAEYVIENGGTVYGAAFSEDNVVRHIGVNRIEELYRFRNSKYVQSDSSHVYREIKDKLENNEFVCFSGTPCQAEGLHCFLNKDYEKLIIVDVVCHAVPSPLVFKKYLEYKSSELKEEKISLLFREKYYGYMYPNLCIHNSKDEIVYHNGIESDEMLRAFFSNICDRPSCYECKFKKRYRVSDYTIWDCFNVSDFFPKIDNNKGATRMLVHTKKGNKYFEIFKDKLIYKSINPDELVKGSKEMLKSVDKNDRRVDFFEDINNMQAKSVFEKYFPVTISTRLEKAIRIAGNKLGIYKLIRKTYKKLFGDRKR